MAEIHLTRGKVAVVDDDDFAPLSKYNWVATPSQHGWRAYRRSRKGEFPTQRTIYMHRQIMGFPESEVDHKNRNGLDNRRANLRLATRQQQAANSEWKRPNGFRGIYRHKYGWCARVCVNGSARHLGLFKTPEAAAKSYDAGAADAFGEFAVLNFPQNKNNNQQ